VQASAKTGFRGLTVHFLSKLLKVLNMNFAKGCTPRTEVALVTALLNFVEPGITEVEIQKRFEARGRKVELDQIETLLMKDGYLDMAVDIIDPSDHAALKKLEKE